jgi:hypothetical protein
MGMIGGISGMECGVLLLLWLLLGMEIFIRLLIWADVLESSLVSGEIS